MGTGVWCWEMKTGERGTTRSGHGLRWALEGGSRNGENCGEKEGQKQKVPSSIKYSSLENHGGVERFPQHRSRATWFSSSRIWWCKESEFSLPTCCGYPLPHGPVLNAEDALPLCKSDCCPLGDEAGLAVNKPPRRGLGLRSSWPGWGMPRRQQSAGGPGGTLQVSAGGSNVTAPSSPQHSPTAPTSNPLQPTQHRLDLKLDAIAIPDTTSPTPGS